MTIHRRALLAGATGLVAAGCADIVGPPPSPKLYRLAPAIAPQPSGPVLPWILVVQRPDPVGGLESERIVLTRPPVGLDFYADAAWSGPLPDLVQASLIQALDGSGRFKAVVRGRDTVRADCLLNCDLRAFEARYDQGESAPLAVVRLAVRLVDMRAHKIVAARECAKEVRASANSVEAAVIALTGAFGAVLEEVLAFVSQQHLSDLPA